MTLTVDGVMRPWNLPTTTIRVADPTKLPIGEATERGDSALLDWYSLLQAEDPEDTIPMDLSEFGKGAP